MKQCHLFISGYVQGVGYRYFVKRNALRLGLKGWVRNTSDGRVETVLQGDEAKVKQMIKISRKGPFLSEVKDIQVEWKESEEEFKDFEVIH